MSFEELKLLYDSVVIDHQLYLDGKTALTVEQAKEVSQKPYELKKQLQKKCPHDHVQYLTGMEID